MCTLGPRGSNLTLCSVFCATCNNSEKNLCRLRASSSRATGVAGGSCMPLHSSSTCSSLLSRGSCCCETQSGSRPTAETTHVKNRCHLQGERLVFSNSQDFHPELPTCRAFKLSPWPPREKNYRIIDHIGGKRLPIRLISP